MLGASSLHVDDGPSGSAFFVQLAEYQLRLLCPVLQPLAFALPASSTLFFHAASIAQSRKPSAGVAIPRFPFYMLAMSSTGFSWFLSHGDFHQYRSSGYANKEKPVKPRWSLGCCSLLALAHCCQKTCHSRFSQSSHTSQMRSVCTTVHTAKTAERYAPPGRCQAGR